MKRLLLSLLPALLLASSCSQLFDLMSQVDLDSLTLSPRTVTLSVGNQQSIQLTAALSPENASDQRLVWSSSDESVVSVDSDGLVSAVAVGGPAAITATNRGSGLTAVALIQVRPGVLLSRTSLALPLGSPDFQLNAQVLPAESNQGIEWESLDPAIATVDGQGVVHLLATGTARIQASNTYGDSASCLLQVQDAVVRPAMQVGVNFWNIMWEGWQDYFSSGADWRVGSNPWNPQLLADLALFSGPIRFMDFDEINMNPIMRWSDRVSQTADHYKQASYRQGKSQPIDPSIQKYYSATGSIPLNQIAYEWMIDLCNRTDRDLWINIPTFADQDYVVQLATLIKNNLEAERKVYVEYSNETWNGSFLAFNYTIDQGVARGLPGYNKWYQGTAFSVWRSLNIFKAFQDVFGAGAMGSRVIRVLAYNGNYDLMYQAIKNVVYDGSGSLTLNPSLNPHGQKADLMAFAPYIDRDYTTNTLLDGASAGIQSQFRQSVDFMADKIIPGYLNSGNYFVHGPKSIATAFGMQLGTYEGGAGLSVNARAWNTNSAIYDEYRHFLDRLAGQGLKIFMQYTLYARYDNNSAWGLKQQAADSGERLVSPKFAAVRDWMQGRP